MFAGVFGGGVTPDPIPNSEVKPSSGDGTALESVWESSTMPAFFLTLVAFGDQGFFLWISMKLQIEFRGDQVCLVRVGFHQS